MGLKETYLENVETQMKEWSTQLKELKIMAENNYLHEFENLEETYGMLKQKVEEIKTADNKTWEKLARDLQGIMLEFKNTIAGTLTKLK